MAAVGEQLHHRAEEPEIAAVEHEPEDPQRPGLGFHARDSLAGRSLGSGTMRRESLGPGAAGTAVAVTARIPGRPGAYRAARLPRRGHPRRRHLADGDPEPPASLREGAVDGRLARADPPRRRRPLRRRRERRRVLVDRRFARSRPGPDRRGRARVRELRGAMRQRAAERSRQAWSFRCRCCSATARASTGLGYPRTPSPGRPSRPSARGMPVLSFRLDDLVSHFGLADADADEDRRRRRGGLRAGRVAGDAGEAGAALGPGRDRAERGRCGRRRAGPGRIRPDRTGGRAPREPLARVWYGVFERG